MSNVPVVEGLDARISVKRYDSGCARAHARVHARSSEPLPSVWCAQIPKILDHM